MRDAISGAIVGPLISVRYGPGPGAAGTSGMALDVNLWDEYQLHVRRTVHTGGMRCDGC